MVLDKARHLLHTLESTDLPSETLLIFNIFVDCFVKRFPRVRTPWRICLHGRNDTECLQGKMLPNSDGKCKKVHRDIAVTEHKQVQLTSPYEKPCSCSKVAMAETLYNCSHCRVPSLLLLQQMISSSNLLSNGSETQILNLPGEAPSPRAIFCVLHLLTRSMWVIGYVRPGKDCP